MALLSSIVNLRELLRDNFPKAGPRGARTEHLFFEEGADQYTFGQSLKNKRFAWFLRVESSLLQRCPDLPHWVIEIRDAMILLTPEIRSQKAEELWGEFLARPWIDECRISTEPGGVKGTDYSKLSFDVYRSEPWTIELIRCSFDDNWLKELEAFARLQPAAPLPVQFVENGVRIWGAEPITVSDRSQLILLRVVHEAGRRITIPEINKKAKEKYGTSFSKPSRLLRALPRELRALIDNRNSGYLFVPPPLPSVPT